MVSMSSGHCETHVAVIHYYSIMSIIYTVLGCIITTDVGLHRANSPSLVPGPRDDPFPTLSPHSKEGVEGWETDSGEFYLRNRCMSTASSEFLEKGIKVILLQSLGPTEVSPPS